MVIAVAGAIRDDKGWILTERKTRWRLEMMIIKRYRIALALSIC
jgi:hypothetical protein